LNNKKKTKIAFLDRDGVLNISTINNGYVGYIKDFKWMPGAKKAIKFLKKKNLKLLLFQINQVLPEVFFLLKMFGNYIDI